MSHTLRLNYLPQLRKCDFSSPSAALGRQRLLVQLINTPPPDGEKTPPATVYFTCHGFYFLAGAPRCERVIDKFFQKKKKPTKKHGASPVRSVRNLSSLAESGALAMTVAFKIKVKDVIHRHTVGPT